MITIILLLPVTLALTSPLKESHRIAGVNQVSSVDDVSHQLLYAFNASEARAVCRSLGLTIASKAQVQSALTQGFQTCRFGWIDEYLAVVPRVTPEPSCGQGKAGLVVWTTSFKKYFDVFCFNESDAGTQLKDTTSDNTATGTDYQERNRSPSKQDATLTSEPLPSTRPSPPPSTSLSSIISASRPISSLALLRLSQRGDEARPKFLSSTQGSFNESHRIAGVNQVSSVDDVSHQLRYAFNASEARAVCRSLGLTIASKAQVYSALTQGFQTCRFGWIDEHLAVVPRVTPEPSCGQGKAGLVVWRTSVKTYFDVFCFNESDAGTQLKDTTSDNTATGTDYQERNRSPSKQDATLTSEPLPSTRPSPPPSTSLSSIISASRPISSLALLRLSQRGDEARPKFLSSTQGSFNVPTKPLLIGVTCALLLVITVVLGLEQLNRSCFQNWDMRQQEDSIDTEENARVIRELSKEVQEVKLEEGTDDRNSLNTAL